MKFTVRCLIIAALLTIAAAPQPPVKDAPKPGFPGPPRSLTVADQHRAISASGAMVPGHLYLIENCAGDQPCYVRVESHSFDDSPTGRIAESYNLPSKHVFCGINFYFGLSWVARLSMHINTTFYENASRTPLVFNYGDRYGTNTFFGWKWSGLSGPSVYPGYDQYAAKLASASLEGTLSGFCLLGVCKDTLNASAHLRFTRDGWSCRVFQGRF